MHYVSQHCNNNSFNNAWKLDRYLRYECITKTEYLTIILFPLFASLIANNRYCGVKGGPVLSVLCKKLGAITSVIIFYEVGLSGSPVSIELGNWIDYGNILIEWNLYYDTLTVSKYLPIVVISFLIQIYSLEYMGHDVHMPRFFSILSLFAVTM